ncbi:MAG: hypothetical protein ACJAS1_002526 [Oleiphilaceae bacterium]
MAALTAQAEKVDQSIINDGMDIPAEIAQRETCLERLLAAKARMDARHSGVELKADEHPENDVMEILRTFDIKKERMTLSQQDGKLKMPLKI